MSKFNYDPQRIAGCIDRIRLSIKLVPWVFVPATSAIISLPGAAFGPVALVFLAILGLIAGFYLSVIAAAVLEWMALMLISTSRRCAEGSQDESSN